MIVVPGKFICVGSPRSGSYYIHDVLEKHFPEAQRWHEHHACIADVLNAKRMGGGLPVYSVVRHPLKQLFSFYWNTLHKYPDKIVLTTFEQFIEGRKPINEPYPRAVAFPPGALTTYRHVTDKFFPFEKDFVSLFKELGITDDYNVKRTRMPTPEYVEAQKAITEADKLLVKKYFKKDYELYKQVRDSYPR
jgi:hypothetical protein